MRTRVILVVSVMLLLVTVAILALGTGFTTQAQKEPELTQLQLVTAEEFPLSRSESVVQAEVDTYKTYPIDPAVVAENARVRAQRQQLADRWVVSMLASNLLTADGQEFWVYRKVMEDRNDDDASVDLEGNIVIPADYIMETWSRLDKEGMIMAQVSMMWDLEGNLLQFGRLRDGISYSSFFNEATTAKEPVSFIWTATVTDDAQRVTQETAVIEGRDVTVFSFQQRIPPVPVDDLDGAAVAGIHTREMYDTQTGQNFRTEVILLLADGNERPAVISDYLSVKIMSQLPKQAAEIFNQELDVAVQEVNHE